MRINSLQRNSKIIEIENKLNGLIDVFYPVGSYYETSDKNFNPNISWGGTWKKDNSGVFLVSEDSSLTLGNTGGEKTHQLTINEMPRHRHNGIYDGNSWSIVVDNKVSGNTIGYCITDNPVRGADRTMNTEVAGESQSHNNMPPYLVVARWHRIS